MTLIDKAEALALIYRKVGKDHPALADELRHAIAALPARVEGLTGALEFYAEDGWKDRPLDPPTPEEVEMFGGNILDFPMPEVFFDRGERARTALSATATTEANHG